jgi:hypothetical protein
VGTDVVGDAVVGEAVGDMVGLVHCVDDHTSAMS